MRALPLLLLLTGCWSTHTATMKQARELEQAGQLEDAEQAWAAAMRSELTPSEWQRSRERFCALYAERMDPVVHALTPDSLSYAEADALRAELQRCPETAALDAEVKLLTALRAEASLAEAEALQAQGRLYEAAVAALPHVQRLPEDHPKREWYAALRQAWRAELDDRAAHLPADARVTQAALGELMRRSGAGEDPGTAPVEAAAQPALSPTPGARTLRTDEACASLSLPAARPDTPGGYRVSAELRDCSGRASVRQETIDYTETRYRTEIQEVQREEVVTVQTVTPTYNVNCYESWNTGDTVCTNVGYYNDVETETYTNTWVEQVEVQVPYEVPMTRQGLFGTRSASMQLTVVVEGADGRSEASRSFSTSERSPEASPGTPEADVLAKTPSAERLFAKLGEQGLAEIDSVAGSLARDLRLAALRRQGAERSDPAAAREALLTVWAGGGALSEEERAFVAEGLGLPAAALADWSALPQLGEDAPIDVRAALATYRLPKINNTVSKGYPPVLASIGYTHHEGAELIGQPTRTAAGLTMEMRYGVGGVTRGNRGLGVHLSPAVQLAYERRTSEDYSFPPNAEGFPNEEEQTTAAGYRLSVDALVGYRGRYLGLFVGAAPRLDGHLIGFYNARAVSVTPTARLELRPIERYPILLEGWWGDVRAPMAPGVGARGGQLWFPLAANTYLHVRAEEVWLRTQFKGLASYDDVDAGLQPLRVLAVGLSLGI